MRIWRQRVTSPQQKWSAKAYEGRGIHYGVVSTEIESDTGFCHAAPPAQAPLDRLVAVGRHQVKLLPDRCFRAALGAAAIAHVVLLVLLSIPDEHRFVGAGGFDIEAVSVEVSVVSATALMSRLSLADAAPISAVPVENSLGSIAPESETAEARNARNQKQARPMPPAVIEALPDRSPEADAPSLPVADKLSSQPEFLEKGQAPNELKPEHNPDRVTLAPSVAEGGVASQGITNTRVTTDGAAAASPGEIQRYARAIVEILGRNRPKGAPAGKRGTVRVSFALDEGGECGGGLWQARCQQGCGTHGGGVQRDHGSFARSTCANTSGARAHSSDPAADEPRPPFDEACTCSDHR